MKCLKCDFSEEDILNVIDDGHKCVVLCPNHIAGIALGAYSFEELEGKESKHVPSGKCDCCAQDALYYKDDVEYQVCPAHFLKLIKRSLSTDEWKVLSKKYGRDAFLLHCDFYDSEGNAVAEIE